MPHPCWIAPRDIPPGTPWATAIMAAIAEAGAVLLLHSANSAASDMVMREINAATDARKPIIPLRLDAAPIEHAMSFYLGATHWLDASTGPLSDHLSRIVAALPQRVGQAAPQAAAQLPTLALPDIPSLVVLPFQNMSGDPEQDSRQLRDGARDLRDQMAQGLAGEEAPVVRQLIENKRVERYRRDLTPAEIAIVG